MSETVMSIDNLSRPELVKLLDGLKAQRAWKHLPQHYAEAGQKVRAAYVRHDHATALRYSLWAASALLAEHPSNKPMAVKLFNGQEP